MRYNLASRMEGVVPSEVREILKLASNPNILSFAGGLPDPVLFPIEELRNEADLVLQKRGYEALQYAPTEGYVPLRRWIIDRVNSRWGENINLDEIMIVSGSQSALDLLAKVFLDAGDTIWCEDPTYLAAISAFRSCQANFESMPCDEDGVIIDGLEERLRTKPPKLIYVIPNFQNPSGRTWSMERRAQFVELMNKYEVPVIEDNAYYELNFDNLPLCSLAKFDKNGSIFTLGSFSKVMCPGLRVAWLSGHKEIIRKAVIIKQATDLQTSTYVQMMVYNWASKYDFDARLKKICELYSQRRDVMLKSLSMYAPEGVTFTRPGGGMFVWMEMPPKVRARSLLDRALRKNVAIVPGDAFYAISPRFNTTRLNFSRMSEEFIARGVKILCECIKEEMKGR